MIGLAIASLVVAAGSAYMQNKNQRAAIREQRRAGAIAQAQNQVKAQNDIRAQIRQQRIRTAQIMQASANTGTSGSSGELGGVATLATQVGGNVGTISEGAITDQAILGHQNAAAGYLGKAQTWGAVGQLASTSFSVFSQTPQWQKFVSS